MGESLAESLNRDCRCISIDHARLEAETQRLMEASHVAFGPWDKSALFASVPVYIGRRHLEEMRETVAVIEELTTSPVYRQEVLSRAKDIARLENPSRGVFFGYDFHLGQDGPQLIEVNTNAGGAMLNLLLGKAQKACVSRLDVPVECATNLEGLEERFVDMFRSDWELARGQRPLKTIAIVDDAPEEQFLYREFLLFRQLLKHAGFDAVIVDAAALQYQSGQLSFEGQPIDMVYNRLVDFYFEESRHRALHDAYVDGTVVVTPHPRAHALYADKRNLVLLRDEHLLVDAGLSATQRATLLRNVPETRLLDKSEADGYWRDRKSWFFKPIQGYGSKAAYRGDKLTKSTFADILERDYVAQRLVPPSQRHVEVEGVVVPLKLDVRCFVYNRTVELWAARLYNGQTTNFRTLGGGFAPIYTESSTVRATLESVAPRSP
jgi:hypothetical protein